MTVSAMVVVKQDEEKEKDEVEEEVVG